MPATLCQPAARATGRTPAPLSARQIDVLTAIRDYRHRIGISPTMQELADELGVSKVTIFQQVGVLEKKGWIRRDKNRSRSITILRDVDDSPAAGVGPMLPVLGNLSADGLESMETREELSLERIFDAGHGVFFLRVQGDWLSRLHLADGDALVIDRRDHARHGERVVFIGADGNARVGRVRPIDGKKCIGSDHEDFDPVLVEKVKIVGVVVGMVRQPASVEVA